MDVLKWIKDRLPRNRDDIKMDDNSIEVCDLDLGQALKTHSEWHERLKAMLHGDSKESLNAENVSRDCDCDLGRWIYTQGKKEFSASPKYEILRQTHANFHRCAGKIVKAHEEGDDAAAKELLDGDFKKLSGKIQIDLVTLFNKS